MDRNVVARHYHRFMRAFLCLILLTACGEPQSSERTDPPTPAVEAEPATPEPVVAEPAPAEPAPEPVAAPVEPAIVPVVPVEATGEPAPTRSRVRTSTRSQDQANLRRLREAGGVDALREARRDPNRARELLRNAQRSGQVRR